MFLLGVAVLKHDSHPDPYKGQDPNNNAQAQNPHYIPDN